MERSFGGESLLVVVVSWFMIFTLNPVYSDYQGNALNDFKVSCEAGGDPKDVFGSWNPTNVNPCSWSRITCDIAQEHVLRVDLGNAGLSCSLVPSLGQLNYLQYLELFGNNISGTIPIELGDLSSLLSLDLFNNTLTGPIPESLGSLSNLRYLRLNNNNLNGTIPFALTKTSSLVVLNLSHNSLTGEVPTEGSFAEFTFGSFCSNPNLKFRGEELGECE